MFSRLVAMFLMIAIDLLYQFRPARADDLGLLIEGHWVKAANGIDKCNSLQGAILILAGDTIRVWNLQSSTTFSWRIVQREDDSLYLETEGGGRTILRLNGNEGMLFLQNGSEVGLLKCGANAANPAVTEKSTSHPLLEFIPAPVPTLGPSFDCATSLAVDEQAICHNPQLALQDRQMAALFVELKSTLDRSSANRLATDQKAWFKSRRSCAADETCLGSSYSARIRDLQNFH